jgi:membrane protein YqaA with SNARE-associated domain
LIEHLSLFGVAFLAATILPGSSEAMLAALVVLNPASVVTLFLAATIGNVLGAIVNWLLGHWFMHYAGHRWFPTAAKRIEQASSMFEKYGSWPLLFSWLPIIGDPLTVAAGVLNIRLPIFVALVSIGKALRYAAVILGVAAVQGAV